MRKIVVGINGSEASRQALRWAAGEAKLRGATLGIVHSWRRPDKASGPLWPMPQLGGKFDTLAEVTEQRVAEDFLRNELDATGVEATGVRIERELVEGDPAETLLAAARESDLLVIGSSRDGKVGRAVLGDVAGRCVERAPCPVVIVAALLPASHVE